MSWLFSKGPNLQDTVFNLKLGSKSFNKQSQKAEKEEKKERAKLKKAIEQKRPDIARIYAENAIRKENESLNYLRLSSRLDAVASRINSAIMMQQTTKNMTGVCKGIDQALASMDLVKVMGVMDKFEDQVGRLDQTDAMMQGSLQGALGTMTPETEVDALIMEVGDAEGLAVDEMLSKDRVADNTLKVEDDVALPQVDEGALSQRLAALRG